MIYSLEMDEQKPPPDMLVHCRICHNEDEESNMETPCSCRGTIKYAHRNCVQRWCNEKGDTSCEICLQQFIPGYVAPRPTSLFQYGGSLMNFGRGNYWEISRRDLPNHHLFIAAMFAANNREFLDTEYSAPSTRTLICCRIVATIFIVLLALRHTLSIIMILKGAEEYHSLTVGMLLMLGMIGAVVPLCRMVKVTIAMQRLQYQDHHSPAPLHEEHNLGPSQQRVLHIG